MVAACGIRMAVSGTLVPANRVDIDFTFVPKRQNRPIGVFQIATSFLPIRHQADFYVRRT